MKQQVAVIGLGRFGSAVAEELVRSGIRARFGQAMMDSGEGVPTGLLETTGASLDAARALTKRWHKASSGRIGAASGRSRSSGGESRSRSC
jgi:cytosine/adenosine deaminase-related metal-dependent hydrolase